MSGVHGRRISGVAIRMLWFWETFANLWMGRVMERVLDSVLDVGFGLQPAPGAMGTLTSNYLAL